MRLLRKLTATQDKENSKPAAQKKTAAITGSRSENYNL